MALPAFTFDTHKFVRKLKGAGFNEEQAEALTDAVQESHASLDVATKQDVTDLRRDTKQDIANVRRDMEQGFSDVRREISDLRKDMDAMETRFDAKLDKLALQLTTRLGALVVGSLTVLSIIFGFITKFVH